MGVVATARRARIDFASVLCLPLGLAIVVSAQIIEGGALRSLLQGAAALIVFGGTLAAVLVSYSPGEVLKAARAAGATFTSAPDDDEDLSQRLVRLSVKAHRGGMLALEPDIERIDDAFLRNGLTLAVDGVSPDGLRELMAAERRVREADDEAPARVFEAAAGYAPTLGILGAVLGLIQVMEHLSEPASLGSGIATAFVATVYGVGSANLVFLPIAGRLRECAVARSRRREVIAEALCAMQARMNPRLVAQKLKALTA